MAWARHFQLTTSRGGRPPKQICFLVCLRFSTHDLSWRSTSSIVSITQTVFFQLTTSRGDRQWRKIKMETKIFFQLTTSRGDRPYAYCVAVLSDFFNSRPLVEVDSPGIWTLRIIRYFQLTTSRGGRQLKASSFKEVKSFSTHDLSWRSTFAETGLISASIFQLTTSRGGRLSLRCSSVILMFFQLTTSRGGRLVLPCDVNQVFFSTHDLSWRSTRRSGR